MGDRTRLTIEIGRLGEELLHPLLGLIGVEPGNLPVCLTTRLGVDPIRHFLLKATRLLDQGAGGQIELTPPGHVGGVAPCADHGDATPLLRVGQMMRHHRKLDIEERGGDCRSEKRLVPLVLRVGDQGDAGGDQLGPGGLDEQRGLVRFPESHPVVGGGTFPVFQLGLGDRRLEIDIPEHRCLLGVGLTPGQVVKECPLTGALAMGIDGGIALIQSTDNPSVRHRSSKTFSSSAVSPWHSSMKFRLLIEIGGSDGSSAG